MIVDDNSGIIDDRSDALSTNTLVPTEKIPPYFVHLTYASLGFSILPFIFSLVNVAISPLHSIPTILAYVFTTPFHIAALLVVWQHKRQIDTTLPFEPSATRTMAYTCFLTGLWIFSTVTCGVGSQKFVKLGPCPPVAPDAPPTLILVPCNIPHKRVVASFVVSTVLAGFEVIIVGAIIVVCYLHRAKAKKSSVVPPESYPMTSPNPKIVSA
jgi:hypothetical protein